jgi:predicted membrane GTPase involved in stress response
MFLSISSTLNANPFSVYFADVITENNQEILYFEWRPDYRSYDKAIITHDNGEVLAEISSPKSSYDITKLQGQGALFITVVR